MSKAPAMPMYWDAYLADTTHLTTEEHGAYMLLLAAMWRRNGSVPDDDKDNARILGLTPAKWRKTKARFIETISGFTIESGTITQEKLRKTWEITQEKIEKNARNGAKGGQAKSRNNKDLDQANATNSLKPKATIPEPEPDTVKREANASPKKRASRLSENWVLPADWGKWAVSEGWAESVVRSEAEKFRDYWIGVGGQKGAKLDWQATWRNWMRNSKKPQFSAINGGQNGQPANKSQRRMDAFIAGAARTS
jgi:uncharacterized protein YdaU (DUF1376 family)